MSPSQSALTALNLDLGADSARQLRSRFPGADQALLPLADYSGPSKLPGSATHVLDPRLNLLATLIPGIFAAKHCLDVGCNAGSVSCQLGTFDSGSPRFALQPIITLRSDIDALPLQPSTFMLLPSLASTLTQSSSPRPTSCSLCALPVPGPVPNMPNLPSTTFPSRPCSPTAIALSRRARRRLLFLASRRQRLAPGPG